MGATVLGRAPHFLGLCLQEPHKALTVKIMERSPCGSSRGGGRLILIKYSQSILHHKSLLCRGKSVLEPYSSWRMGVSPIQLSLA